MSAQGRRRAAGWIALGVGAATATYATLVTAAYRRYGKPPAPAPDEADSVLDAFMPSYEIAERHHVRVYAPADITLRAAMEVRLQDSLIVRAIFKARELVLGAEPSRSEQSQGLLHQTLSLGWRVLHEEPGRQIVVGAVTQPWLPDVVFRGIAPEEFPTFDEPDHVKIVWTLRVEPEGPSETICRTETRAATTDAAARARFRWYWARFSPGIVLIRHVLMHQLKADAEQAMRAGTPRPA